MGVDAAGVTLRLKVSLIKRPDEGPRPHALPERVRPPCYRLRLSTRLGGAQPLLQELTLSRIKLAEQVDQAQGAGDVPLLQGIGHRVSASVDRLERVQQIQVNRQFLFREPATAPGKRSRLGIEGKRLALIEASVDGLPDQPGGIGGRVSRPRQLPHVELPTQVLFLGEETEDVLEPIREFVRAVDVEDAVPAVLERPRSRDRA